MGRLTDRGAIQQSVSDDTASCLRRLTSAGHYHQHLQPSVQAAIETVHLDTAQLTEVFDDSLKPETNDFFAWTRTHFAFHSISARVRNMSSTLGIASSLRLKAVG